MFNPSEAWAEDTGQLFVFAPWIARPGVDLAPWIDTFLRARARGAADLDQLIAEACDTWSIYAADAQRYLAHECLYEPGDELEPALLRFRDRAAARGLCRPDLRPRPVRRERAHVS